MLKFGMIFALASLAVSSAIAADTASCQDRATEKKLAGAAMTSFMKKCEQDAAVTCEVTSKDKKLAGAAKSSFEKKCVTDAVGKKS